MISDGNFTAPTSGDTIKITMTPFLKNMLILYAGQGSILEILAKSIALLLDNKENYVDIMKKYNMHELVSVAIDAKRLRFHEDCRSYIEKTYADMARKTNK